MEERVNKTSLRKRLTRNIHFLLGITYIITLAVLLSFVRSYFYTNFYNNLKSQGQVAADYYENNIAGTLSLVETLYDDQDTWWQSKDARVQIFDNSGFLLLDSQANLELSSSGFDVTAALAGRVEYDIFKLDKTDEHVMAVSVPLVTTGQIVGVLRYVGSLEQLDRNLASVTLSFFFIGGLITTASAVLAILISKRIVKPVVDLTSTAHSMAQGDYNIKSPVYSDDEIGALSQTFNYMMGEVAKKEELKNDFISSVSHELRTPLTAIKGWSITLRDPATDQELMETGLGIIEQEADRLKALVDDLLDFSKFASGKIELSYSLIQPRELKQFIQHFVDGRKERENKFFCLDIPDDMAPIYGDENRLKQVLINLIDNAFKFTESGGRISVTLKQTPVSNILYVADDGVGISPDEINKVKEKFYRGKHIKSSSGIGLSIVNQIAELHGGNLTIQSKLGEGTTMIVTIPREDRHE